MTQAVTWDPERYVQFGDYRNRPFFDLVHQIRAQSPALVFDLGCGPGNLTASLAERWPEARVIGIDSSPQMIETARALADEHANLSFELGDISAFEPGEADVVVSNAALQWVPGHQELLAQWAAALRPGAWLAFQVPGNFGADSHRLLRELAASPTWQQRLEGVLRPADAVAEPADYLQLLLDAGLQANAWETSYQQLLQGQDPVLDWVRGTALRPVLDVLGEDAGSFEESYRHLVREAYPASEHGTVFPFRRIFAVATRTELNR